MKNKTNITPLVLLSVAFLFISFWLIMIDSSNGILLLKKIGFYLLFIGVIHVFIHFLSKVIKKDDFYTLFCIMYFISFLFVAYNLFVWGQTTRSRQYEEYQQMVERERKEKELRKENGNELVRFTLFGIVMSILIVIVFIYTIHLIRLLCCSKKNEDDKKVK